MRTKNLVFSVLTLLLFTSFAYAQVTGTVVDSFGPIPNAEVRVENSDVVTSTAEDGTFSINAEIGNVLIILNPVLGSTKQFNVSAYDLGTLNFEDATVALGEIVIEGAYGIETRKKELTYQTEQVSAEKLTIAQPTNATEALIGKVAGMNVQIQSNGVNPQTQINLRGLRSINQSSEPAYVIDGALSSAAAFNVLNPADIKSINVLKGATAAAVYGSKAANGVLMITTKKGVRGDKIKIGLNSVFTATEVSYMPEFQKDFGTGWQGVYDAIENTNWGPAFDGEIRQVGPTLANGDYLTLPYSAVNNNLRDFYNTGTSIQNTLYFSGGDEKSDFYVSLSDLNTQGIIPNDEYKRKTFRFNSSRTAGKLRVGLDATYVRENTNVVGDEIAEQARPLYWFVLNTAANIPLRDFSDWRNNPYASNDGWYNGYYQNPYWALDTNRDTSERNRVIGNISTNYKLNDWINLTGRIGVNNVYGIGKNWIERTEYTSDYQRPNSVPSRLQETNYRDLRYTGDLFLTAERDVWENFSTKLTVGLSSTARKYRYTSTTVNNLSIPGFFDVSNGTGIPKVITNEIYYRDYGVFSELVFGYDDWVFLSLSGRNDWVSTLPIGDNSYFYPAAGLSFVATELFPDIKKNGVDFLKFTINTSTIYNGLDPYQINETYLQGRDWPFPYENINGYTLTSIAVDPNIKQERLTNLEFGINTSFLKERIKVDATYFDTKIEDLITESSTAPSSGSTRYLTNIGELSNNGYEISLGLTPVKTKMFRWDLDINYSTSTTIVEEVDPSNPDLTEIKVADYGGNYGIYAIEGEEFPQLKATSYVRDDNGNIVIDPLTGNPLIGGLKNMGRTTPKHMWGLVNSFDVGNFNLTGVMDYRTGHVYYSQLADVMEFTGRSMESVSANREDFIIPNSVYLVDGEYVQNTNIPVTGGLQSYWTDHYNNIKENYVKDASAVVLREISLNYTLPNEWLQNTWVSSMRLGIVGRNLITWLPAENRYSNPDFNNSFANSNIVGVSGYFQSPPTRSYGFSLNVEF